MVGWTFPHPDKRLTSVAERTAGCFKMALVARLIGIGDCPLNISILSVTWYEIYIFGVQHSLPLFD
jgi:hypothetical protein